MPQTCLEMVLAIIEAPTIDEEAEGIQVENRGLHPALQVRASDAESHELAFISNVGLGPLQNSKYHGPIFLLIRLHELLRPLVCCGLVGVVMSS